MNEDELLMMLEANAMAALADEANWPPGITSAVRAEWRKMTPAERLEWIHNIEEIQRTLDPDAFRQWQGRGPDQQRRDSIPAYYRGYWKARRRMKDGL